MDKDLTCPPDKAQIPAQIDTVPLPYCIITSTVRFKMIVVNGVARVARNLGNSVLLRTHPYTGPPVQSPHLPFAIKFLCPRVHAFQHACTCACGFPVALR
eukprot:EG_transcript_44098